MRGDTNSLELARIASAHDLPQFRAFGMFFDGWARVESDLLGGLDGMRRGVDSLHAQNILIFDGLVKIALAKTEAEAGDPAAPLPSSTKRWRSATARAIAHSKQNCIASAAKCCGSVT